MIKSIMDVLSSGPAALVLVMVASAIAGRWRRNRLTRCGYAVYVGGEGRRLILRTTHASTPAQIRRGWAKAARRVDVAVREADRAERRIALALLFVPPGQRERYRQEWVSEMAQLKPAEAAAFALHLLQLAPRMGLLLLFKRAFGRRAA